MENKKKPYSILELVENHHCFENKGVIFSEEMLTWPFMLNKAIEAEDEYYNNIYRMALKSLTQIHPFSSKVSLGVDVGNKRFTYPKRTWGRIYLGEKEILQFSHDPRFENRPFSGLVEWTEMYSFPYDSSKAFTKDSDRIIKELSLWDNDDWVEFFRRKIKERAGFLNQKAKRLKTEAEGYESSAWEVMMNF